MAKTASTKKSTAKRAAKKPAARSAVTLPSRALEHGEQAYGARYLRPGAARTPELDLAFALGHGVGSAFGPIALAPDWDPAKPLPPKFTGAMPRNAALAMLRGTPLVAEPEPLTEAEALQQIPRFVQKLGLVSTYLRAFEAIVGPSCVLTALLDGLERADQQRWNNGGWQQRFPVLHGLMLRVPPAERDAAHARLVALYETIDNKNWYGGDKLDILLHGREGIRRSGYKYSVTYKGYRTRLAGGEDDPSNTTDLCYLDEDRDFVAQQYEALWTAFRWKPQRGMIDPPPARLLFLGGEAALRTELRVVGTYPGTMQVDAFASYAELRGPLVEQLMAALAKPGSKVEKKARAWLDDERA